MFTNGFQWTCGQNVYNTKIATLVCVCDAPARCAVQNFTQYNGAFGCGFCKQEGLVVCKGRGYTNVYPADQKVYEKRTHTETIIHAEEAVESNHQQ